MRRNSDKWTDRWKLVSIYAYNVSLMARANKSGDVFVWGDDVIRELEQGREDGLKLFDLVQTNDDDEEDYDSEDEEEAEVQNQDGTRVTKKRKRTDDEGDADDEEEDEEEEEDSDAGFSGDESERNQSKNRAAHRRQASGKEKDKDKEALEKIPNSGDSTAPPPEVMEFVEELANNWSVEQAAGSPLARTLTEEPSEVAAV